MQLNIIPSSGIAIYKQIYEQIERMIINGQLKVDSLLPSVRQVALELDVNPMTVSKAYALLEERGYVIRQRGKGMLVSARDEIISEQEKLMNLQEKIDALMNEAEQMGISLDKLMLVFQQYIKQKNNQLEHAEYCQKSSKE